MSFKSLEHLTNKKSLSQKQMNSERVREREKTTPTQINRSNLSTLLTRCFFVIQVSCVRKKNFNDCVHLLSHELSTIAAGVAAAAGDRSLIDNMTRKYVVISDNIKNHTKTIKIFQILHKFSVLFCH